MGYNPNSAGDRRSQVQGHHGQLSRIFAQKRKRRKWVGDTAQWFQSSVSRTGKTKSPLKVDMVFGCRPSVNILVFNVHPQSWRITQGRCRGKRDVLLFLPVSDFFSRYVSWKYSEDSGFHWLLVFKVALWWWLLSQWEVPSGQLLSRMSFRLPLSWCLKRAKQEREQVN